MITDELLNTDPFNFSKQNQSLFLESVRETAKIHFEGNGYFHFLWDKKGIKPEKINSEKDLENMPFIMVNLLKKYEFFTGKFKDIVLTLGSSGTSGQRSLIYLDQTSLDRVKKLAYNIHHSLEMTSSKKYNYLCFTYDPYIAKDLGTAFTDELLTSFTDKADVFYTFKHNGEEFYYDENGTLETLKEFEKSPYPTRILGFPAYIYKLVKDHSLSLNLGSDSWIQTGGGWKGHADEEIPKNKFRKIMSESLGIPEKNIRDLFGMVEHGIPYVDYIDGKLRIPNYSRVLIRDPKTLEVLPNGKVGLIQFICTYNTSFPAMSLLTTDWGVKYNSLDKGEVLEIRGRAGISKNVGCALKALELGIG